MFDVKVMQRIATISENKRNGKSLQLNVVSVNGGPDQIDIARWVPDENGKLQRRSGIILSSTEYECLKMEMENY